jgi:predicted nucleotidyltransferase component of viral defense system
MTFKDLYIKQADLVLTIMGLMDWNGCFALKGGTALNFFYADMPRLSVDIDLVYLRINSRQDALREIKATLKEYKRKFESLGFSVHMTEGGADELVGKLVVSREGVSIKIEPNTVIRGSLYAIEKRSLNPVARDEFKQDLDVVCLDHRELMGGKLVAMLDRQHPRDIFDMKCFLDHQGALADCKEAFAFYLLQSNRPFSEVLRPRLKDLEEAFSGGFQGMTRTEIFLNDLIKCRREIVEQLPGVLGVAFGEFLVSILEQEPKWDFLVNKNFADYPGIQWKQLNIKKMSDDKVRDEIRNIRAIFSNLP